MRALGFSSVALLLLSACTFVKMAPGADSVRVAAAGKSMAACEKRGEVVVSVKNRLGPYERDAMRVRDELETLARNEAPSLRADTVQPKSEPQDGEQRFLAYRCDGGAVPSAAAAPPPPADSAHTVPLKD